MSIFQLQALRIERAHRWLARHGHGVSVDAVAHEWIKRFATKWRAHYERRQAA